MDCHKIRSEMAKTCSLRGACCCCFVVQQVLPCFAEVSTLSKKANPYTCVAHALKHACLGACVSWSGGGVVCLCVDLAHTVCKRCTCCEELMRSH